MLKVGTMLIPKGHNQETAIIEGLEESPYTSRDWFYVIRTLESNRKARLKFDEVLVYYEIGEYNEMARVLFSCDGYE